MKGGKPSIHTNEAQLVRLKVKEKAEKGPPQFPTMIEDSDEELYPYYDNADSSAWRRSQLPDDSKARSAHSAKQSIKGLDRSSAVLDSQHSESEVADSLAHYQKSLRKLAQNISSIRGYLDQEADVDPKVSGNDCLLSSRKARRGSIFSILEFHCSEI